MCGIVGVVHFNAHETANPDLLLKMSNSIAHRGPDDHGQYCYKNMGISMRRLSIIGIETGHQPIPNEDKTVWVVLNGEIYNYRELRECLEKKGHSFRSASDTECIVHLYEEYGEQCVQYLRGMFSFAVIDKKNDCLFTARDRLGIKPFFYSIQGGKMLFASELKAILCDETVSRSLDFSALDAYFTYTYIPAPMTIFKEIKKLEPGHFMKYDNKGIRIEKYWDFNYRPDLKKSEKEFAEEFIQLFDESVKLHLMSEVPLGAFLSGGIDSGLMVAFMARHMTSPVQAFTIGFSGQIGNYLDERRYAKSIAEKYHVNYHEFEVNPNLEDIIDSIVRSFDEPFADDSVIPSYYICKLAREHVTVALTGLGGDELFAGYERYLGLSLSRLYQKIPYMIRKKIIQPVIENSSSQTALIGHIKRFVRSDDDNDAHRYMNYMSVLSDAAKFRFYSKEFQNEVDYALTEEYGVKYFNAQNTEVLLDKALFQDSKMYLPDDILALSDRLSMHHSLELRVPFVDHKLVEYCATIPSAMKIRFFQKKHILKKIAAKYLPPDVIYHRKQGFASPMASWLRNDLKTYSLELLADNNLNKHKFFNNTYVANVLNEHINGRESNEKLIFSLMIFQKWYEAYC